MRRSTALSILPIAGSLVSAHPTHTATPGVSSSATLGDRADTDFGPTRTPSTYCLAPRSSATQPENAWQADASNLKSSTTYVPQTAGEGSGPFHDPDESFDNPAPETPNDDQTEDSRGLPLEAKAGIVFGVCFAAVTTSLVVGGYRDQHPGEITRRACNAWKGAGSLCSRAVPWGKKPTESSTTGHSMELEQHVSEWSLNRFEGDGLQTPPPAYHEICHRS